MRETKVVYIKRRILFNIFLTIAVSAFSLVYTKTIRNGALKVFLNNAREMPIYSVDIPDRRIALTFDLGWGDQNTQEIVETLKRYDAKATFFVTGAWAEQYPEMIAEIAGGGHEIGNHSTNHIKMTGIPKSRSSSEIRETEGIVKKLSGVVTVLFRPPYGEYDNALIAAAGDIGYKSIQYDVDSMDWRGISEDDIADRVLRGAAGGSIVLFHNNAPNTPGALCRIIEELRKDGYRFVTVSDMLLKDDYYIDSGGRQKSLK